MNLIDVARVGDTVARGPGLARARQVAVLLGVLGIVLAAIVPLVVSVSRAAIIERGTSRAPVISLVADDENAVVRWAVVQDDVGLNSVDITSISPLTAEAPLPPGLEFWPSPGGVVMSPSLYDELSAQGAIDRYGTVEGFIGNEGLAIPGELFAYVRPHLDTVPRGFEITGFGGALASPLQGSALPLSSLGATYAVIGIYVVLPALILIGVAIFMGAAERGARLRALQLLGANRQQLLAYAAGEVFRPGLAGGLAGLLLVAVLFRADFRLPLVGHVLVANDLRQAWVGLAVSLVAAWILAMTLTIIMGIFGASRGRWRPRAVRPGSGRAIALICVLTLLATPRLFSLIIGERTGNESLAMWVMTAGSIIALATLPSLVRVCLEVLARVVTESRKRLLMPARLLASAMTQANPLPLTRIASVGATLVALAGLMQVWSSVLSVDMVQAEQLHRSVQDTLVEIEPSGDDADLVLGHIIDSLPPAHHPVAVGEGPSGRVLVRGGAVPLELLGLDGEPVTVRSGKLPGSLVAYMRYRGLDVGEVIGVEEPTLELTAPTQLLVFVDGGQDADVNGIKRAVFRHAPAGWPVASPGAGWRSAGEALRTDGRWLALYAGLGAILLTAAGWSGSVNYLLSAVRRATPIVVLFGRPSFARAMMAALIIPSVLLGLVIGVAATMLLTAPFLGSSLGSRQPSESYIAISSIVVLGGIVSWVVAVHMVTRAAERWVPGRRDIEIGSGWRAP